MILSDQVLFDRRHVWRGRQIIDQDYMDEDFQEVTRSSTANLEVAQNEIKKVAIRSNKRSRRRGERPDLKSRLTDWRTIYVLTDRQTASVCLYMPVYLSLSLSLCLCVCLLLVGRQCSLSELSVSHSVHEARRHRRGEC